tara:strand:- start:1329 stop:1853 length:525 start_codon:yes stop_codon:yes gene_type:complete
MSGSLNLIQKITLSTPTASAVLTGIDSTYDVYMVRISNMQPVTDNKNMIFHITKSGTADTTSNYDHAYENIKVNTSFSTSSGENASSATFAWSQGNGTGEKASAILYLFNFANASEYSFITVDSHWYNTTPDFMGAIGGLVHTSASASDGVSFTMESAVNINTGAEFALYGITK